MGDVSAEPSMEDILSSIKRIIAEEGDDRPVRPRRNGTVRVVAPAPPIDEEEGEEVLELSDPMPPAPPRAGDAAPTPKLAAAEPGREPGLL